MENSICPWCGTTQSLRPNLKLLVNTCGHSMCEECVDFYFVREYGQCPECSQLLKKKDFHVPLLNEPNVEEEKDAESTDMYHDDDIVHQFSTGTNCAPLQALFYDISIDEAPVHVYEPPATLKDGLPPTMVEIENNRYLAIVCPDTLMERADGLPTNLACLIVIQEAFLGLYTTKKVPSEKTQIPDIYKLTNLD